MNLKGHLHEPCSSDGEVRRKATGPNRSSPWRNRGFSTQRIGT